MTNIRFDNIDFSLIKSGENILKLSEGSVKSSMYMGHKDAEVSNLIESAVLMYENNNTYIKALMKLNDAINDCKKMDARDLYISSCLDAMLDLMLNTKILADNGVVNYGKLSDAQAVVKKIKGAL